MDLETAQVEAAERAASGADRVDLGVRGGVVRGGDGVGSLGDDFAAEGDDGSEGSPAAADIVNREIDGPEDRIVGQATSSR